jgi:hypothetical protein
MDRSKGNRNDPNMRRHPDMFISEVIAYTDDDGTITELELQGEHAGYEDAPTWMLAFVDKDTSFRMFNRADSEPCVARDIPACNIAGLFALPWPEGITSLEVGPPHRDPAATQLVTIKGTRRCIRELLNDQWNGGIEDFTLCIEREDA